ncbi:MAG: hypothetical protein U0271_10750 [Polyangiaceae bacterium]
MSTSAPPASPSPAARSAFPWRAIVVLLAVFVLGGAAGFALGRTSAMRELDRKMGGPPAEARAAFRLEAMRRHLDLSDAQVDQLKTVLADAERERDQIMTSCGPGLEDLRERTDAKVRTILTEAQQKKFDELEERRRKHGFGPHGPPPP